VEAKSGQRSSGVGFLFFSTSSKKTETPPEWFGTHLHAFSARLQAELAAG
jgi:hypothetical protein